MESVLLLIELLVIYFIPSLIACYKLHNNVKDIFICNFFLGWTYLGWIVALNCACTDNIKNKKEKYYGR